MLYLTREYPHTKTDKGKKDGRKSKDFPEY
jgi:hypothetical protein